MTRRNTKKNQNLVRLKQKIREERKESKTDKNVRFKIPRARSEDISCNEQGASESEGVRLDLYSNLRNIE